MSKTLEKTYGEAVRGIYFLVNPIKKIIIKTTCIVHKYINSIAIEILKKNGFNEQYKFFSKNINEINDGTVWADQNFKSSNHFFHHETGTGLYGFSDALSECKKYYNMSLGFLRAGDKRKSLFYFGAACHVMQDSTVPQHVHKKLLDNHRGFEVWIITKLKLGYKFEKGKKIIREENLEKYIKVNAKFTNIVYNKYRVIEDENIKNTKISNSIIPRAEMTTAGFMLDYYERYKAIQKILES